MEQVKEVELTDLKQNESVGKKSSPRQLKRRLRALLQQEQRCIKRAFLQQQLFHSQRNTKPNKNQHPRDALLLHMGLAVPRAGAIKQGCLEALQKQTPARQVRAFCSCSRSSAAPAHDPASLRRPKRELADEQQPALRGSIESRETGLLSTEAKCPNRSVMLMPDSDSRALHDGSTKKAITKTEWAGSSVCSLQECITISDSSEDSSGYSSPAPPAIQNPKQKQENNVEGVSRLFRRRSSSVSRCQPLLSSAAAASCSRRGNNEEARIRYDDLNSVSQEVEEIGDERSRTGLVVASSRCMPAACSGAERLQAGLRRKLGQHATVRDEASCRRRMRGENATALRWREHTISLELSAEGSKQQQLHTSRDQEDSTSGEATEDSSSEENPSKVSGWPECVVDMLGPDVFNLLKEEPHLVHATSKTSGMSLFHHMLRRPSKDDEQVLDLFKCIYEDKPLKERVTLPPLTELKCDRGQTLAFYAAAYGHAKCLKWILEQIGGETSQRQFLEIRDNEGDTPLHYAVKNGHVNVIDLLLNTVPEMLNKQRSDGQTPLFDALERPTIVRLLLRRGADYRVRCNRGLTPLETATDELEWKRFCSSRNDRTLPKRLSFSVHLLKKAEGKLGKGASGRGSRQSESSPRCTATAVSSATRLPVASNAVESGSWILHAGGQCSEQKEDECIISSQLGTEANFMNIPRRSQTEGGELSPAAAGAAVQQLEDRDSSCRSGCCSSKIRNCSCTRRGCSSTSSNCSSTSSNFNSTNSNRSSTSSNCGGPSSDSDAQTIAGIAVPPVLKLCDTGGPIGSTSGDHEE